MGIARMTTRIALLLLLLCAMSSPADLLAWGKEGHRIIAALAEARLRPEAVSAVKELVEDGRLREVASWADEVRVDRPETAPWHFVNIPHDALEYEPNRDCTHPREGDCLVAAIERMQSILSDATRPRGDRTEALKFLVHFIGDLHQPLHCIGDHEGGNTMEVMFFSESINPYSGKPWNLHAVWDAGLIERAALGENAYIDHLDSWLKIQAPGDLEQGTVRDWARECHQSGIELIDQLPSDGHVGARYLRDALTVIERHVAMAGLRLARVLNGALIALPIIPPAASR
jgi:hypothetical protein